MKYREVIKIVENDGCFLKRQKGSHRIYRHNAKSGFVIIAGHRLSDEIP